MSVGAFIVLLAITYSVYRIINRVIDIFERKQQHEYTMEKVNDYIKSDNVAHITEDIHSEDFE